MRVEFSKWYVSKDRYIPDYSSETTIVQPNLSLSVQEIFDRWKRNLPLDVVQRNGAFLPKDMSDDEAFNCIDEDKFDDITEVEDYYSTLPFNELNSEESNDSTPAEEVQNLSGMSENASEATQPSE